MSAEPVTTAVAWPLRLTSRTLCCAQERHLIDNAFFITRMKIATVLAPLVSLSSSRRQRGAASRARDARSKHSRHPLAIFATIAVICVLFSRYRLRVFLAKCSTGNGTPRRSSHLVRLFSGESLSSSRRLHRASPGSSIQRTERTTSEINEMKTPLINLPNNTLF